MAEERSLIGQELVGFRLESELGEGGMAVVYRGVNLLDPSIVRAIKVVHPELAGRREFAARFAKEAKILEKLTHENVVRFYGVRREGTWFVMELELLEGRSFAAMLTGWQSAKERAPIGEVVEIMRQASEGVAAAHAQGLVHRDLKPENLFVTREGTAKVLDFGIARAFDQADRATRVTKQGAVPGSPAYMAPEVCKMEEPSPASDVYALGLVLYEALSGEHPFDPPGKRISAMQLMYAQVHEALPPLKERRPDVPDALAAVVERATAKDPKKRYSSARELTDALRCVGVAERVGGTGKEAGGSETSFTEFELPPIPPSEEEKRSKRVEEVSFSKREWRLIAAVGMVSGVMIAGFVYAGFYELKLARGPCPEGMVLISGGRFSMGSEDGDSDEKPVHDVDVVTFCMDETEVTVRAYTACMLNGSCRPAAKTASETMRSKGLIIKPRKRGGESQGMTDWENQACNWNRADRPEHPVSCVGWNEADAYCNAVGKRLPTEEEWEYAARGTDGRKYPWGNELPDSKRVNMAGKIDGWEETAPVGSFILGKSPFGLDDMAGNVWEWTASPYSLDYGLGPVGDRRVRRGGGWNEDEISYVRGANRYGNSPTYRDASLGFRCAKTP